MLIERLRLVNFRQHEDTELLLGPGLIGLIGPNGAGKSTLLEAIAWVMYGMPAARGTRESIRRRGAPPRAPVEVELDFALGSHRYRVRRTLGSAELFLDGDPAPVANSLQAVTDRITRLLGMTRDEFFNTYFTGQKELAVMSSMGATDRAQFLARVLGYDRLRLAQERVRERKTTARATLDALRSGLPDPEALRADVMQARERLAGAEAAAAGAAAALAAAVDRHEQLRPRLVALRARRERAQALVRERDRIGVELDGLAADATRLAAVVADAEGASARLAALAPRLERHARLRAERDALDAVAAAHAERATQVGELEAVRVRQAETAEAAHILSIAEVFNLGHPDGELTPTLELRAQIARLYRVTQADTLLTFDPLWEGQAHPDHIAAGRAALDAYMPSKMRLYHPEQLREAGAGLGCIQRVFLFGTARQPAIYVDISAVRETKVAACVAHRSQFPQGEESLEWLREMDAEIGQAAGLAYAEQFARMEVW